MVSLACQSLSGTGTARPTRTPTPRGIISTPLSSSATQSRYKRIFNRIWNLVDDKYIYTDYRGVDWDAVHDEYAPKVAAARNNAEFWFLMKEMIALLDDNHSGYLTPDEVEFEEQEREGNLDYVGIGVYITIPFDKDYGVILFTFPDSPAEKAGLLPHDRILSIDGSIACCNPDGSDNLDNLQGPANSRVEIVMQSPGEITHTITITRDRIHSQLPVPAQRISTPKGDVGYLLVPTLYDNGIAERARQSLQGLMDEGPLVGLIVDMRINGGGAYTELSDMLSLFTEGTLGSFDTREVQGESTLDITANPVGPSQTLPLALLIGRNTESYAEVFSGSLQDIQRAYVIGEPSAGNVESIYPYDLEDGSRLWLAQETFVPPSGNRWEGRGVQPDLEIPGAWEDFSATNDPQLNAALEWLQKQIK